MALRCKVSGSPEAGAIGIDAARDYGDAHVGLYDTLRLFQTKLVAGHYLERD